MVFWCPAAPAIGGLLGWPTIPAYNVAVIARLDSWVHDLDRILEEKPAELGGLDRSFFGLRLFFRQEG
jgi:hypothetical protein